MTISLTWRNSIHPVKYQVLDWDANWFILKDMFGAVLKIRTGALKNLHAHFN